MKKKILILAFLFFASAPLALAIDGYDVSGAGETDFDGLYCPNANTSMGLTVYALDSGHFLYNILHPNASQYWTFQVDESHEQDAFGVPTYVGGDHYYYQNGTADPVGTYSLGSFGSGAPPSLTLNTTDCGSPPPPPPPPPPLATSTGAILFQAMASSTGEMIGSSLPLWWGVIGIFLGFLALLIFFSTWKTIFLWLKKIIGF